MIRQQIKDTSKILVQEGIETPFYLLDIDEIRSTVLKFKKTWASHFKDFLLAYSYKTNSLKKITTELAKLSCGAEVVSATELHWALSDGFKPSDIFFDGPVKKYNELSFAVKKHVNIQIDSLDELKVFKKISEEREIQSRISIRLCANYKDDLLSRFGHSMNELNESLALLNKSNLSLSGIHIHLGSNINDPTKFEDVISQNRDFIAHVSEQHNTWLDFGGGYPAKSFSATENITQLNQYPNIIKNTLTKFNINLNSKIIAEPGRCLVEDSGYLVARVCVIKERGNKVIAVLDANTSLIRSINSWHHPISIIANNNKKSKSKKKNSLTYSLYGNNCYENDKFCDSIHISNARLSIGDIVIFGSAGGYDIPSANLWTRPLPPIYGIRHGEICVLRQNKGIEYEREGQ